MVRIIVNLIAGGTLGAVYGWYTYAPAHTGAELSLEGTLLFSAALGAAIGCAIGVTGWAYDKLRELIYK